MNNNKDLLKFYFKELFFFFKLVVFCNGLILNRVYFDLKLGYYRKLLVWKKKIIF